MTEFGETPAEWPKVALMLPLSPNVHNMNTALGVCSQVAINLGQALFKEADTIVLESFHFLDTQPRKREYASTALTKQALDIALKDEGYPVVLPQDVPRINDDKLLPVQLEHRIKTLDKRFPGKLGYLAVIGGGRLAPFGVSVQDSLKTGPETNATSSHLKYRDLRDGGIIVPDGAGGWRKHSSGGKTAAYLRD